MSCLFLELFKDIVVPSKPAFLSWVDMKLEMLGWGCAQVGTAELVIPKLPEYSVEKSNHFWIEFST